MLMGIIGWKSRNVYRKVDISKIPKISEGDLIIFG